MNALGFDDFLVPVRDLIPRSSGGAGGDGDRFRRHRRQVGGQTSEQNRNGAEPAEPVQEAQHALPIKHAEQAATAAASTAGHRPWDHRPGNRLDQQIHHLHRNREHQQHNTNQHRSA